MNQPDLFPFSPQDSRAKTSVTPDQNGTEFAATDRRYFSRCRESFAWFDRESWCWKTYQRCLLAGWATFSESWPRSGFVCNGIAYRLLPLAHRTDGTVFGLLPTPAATSYGTNQGGAMGRTGPVRPSLETMARKNLWPTPTVGDAKASGSRNAANSKAHPGVSLTDAVRGDGGTGRLYPTPAAHEGRLGWQDRSTGKKGTQESLTTYVMKSHGREPGEEWNGGQLNPAFVEWLMGYPDGWTDLED